MCYIVDASHTGSMFEILLLVVSAWAVAATVIVTARDGYRRIPRQH